MAVAWTDITNAQVAAGAALTTALVTALRDNPEGIAQRASGAPKIFGVPYDYQEFTANGTWTKPSNAESGDRVVVQVVGGGAGGTSNTQAAGGGAGGLIHVFNDIDDLGATETVVVGAGGSGGASGGDSSYGTSGNFQYLEATGGVHNGAGGTAHYGHASSSSSSAPTGTTGGTEGGTPGGSIFGGGAGQSTGSWNNVGGSVYAGSGGNRSLGFNDGEFPGGGGASGISGSASNGADGVVRVWCIKEG